MAERRKRKIGAGAVAAGAAGGGVAGFVGREAATRYTKPGQRFAESLVTQSRAMGRFKRTPAGHAAKARIEARGTLGKVGAITDMTRNAIKKGVKRAGFSRAGGFAFRHAGKLGVLGGGAAVAGAMALRNRKRR